MPLSESEMEEIRIVAIRLFSSVADGGVAPQLQDGDLVTVEIEELYYRDGTFPASKAAIAALPEVIITKAEEEGGLVECAICLTEYLAGEVVKEMPCKHRYHSVCIGKWLAIHGSCPFCRYEIIDSGKEDEEIMVVNVYVRRADRNDSDDDDDSGDPLDSEDMEIDYNGSSMEDVD